MTLNLVEHNMKIEDGIVYTADTFDCGNYTIERYAQNGKVTNIYVDKDESVEYLPTVSYRCRWTGNEDPEFVIQTTAYGAKPVGEIEKVIAGYQEAVEVVKILTKNFLK